MQNRPFDDREVEILIRALRYWRVQRGQVVRRTDPVLGTDEIDVLLAKLCGSLATEAAPPAAPSKAVRTYDIFGRVPAGQDVPSGGYTDVVVATVNF